MISRKGYDIVSLIVLVLMIGTIWYSYNVNSRVLMEYMNNRGDTDIFEMQSQIESDPRIMTVTYLTIASRIILAAYWILMIVLAVNLHKKKKISMVELIFIILFAPLAIIFYFLGMRKKYKEVESGSQSVAQTPVNPAAAQLVAVQ